MIALEPGRHIHLVGIGGIGLSAIARVLRGWGYRVSGSDLHPSDLTKKLAAEGIAIHAGHRAEHIAGADLVIASSAVPPSNPELVAARQQGLPVVKRKEFLGVLTAGKTVIAIAGTHGKTTTSAMIAWILSEAGLEPSFIVGGVLQNLGINARAGTGPHFVVEADEYDRAFLGLRPDVAVVTILEHDHPDCYPTFEDMRTAFSSFTEQVREEGLLIVGGDDQEARKLGRAQKKRGRHVTTYGLDPTWDWWAKGLELGNSAAYEVWHRDKLLGTCALQVPGRHNVLNSLAALAASAHVGVDPGTAAAALTRFRGTERRFEIKGQAGGITVVDDYAHHPTEIRATLAAARLKFPGRPIWAVFQPHTYSRTAALLDDFALAFDDADHILVTSIYAAREQNVTGISGRDVATRMAHPDARYVETLQDAVATLLDRIQPGDLVITLGAGDGYQVGEQVLDKLSNHRGAV